MESSSLVYALVEIAQYGVVILSLSLCGVRSPPNTSPPAEPGIFLGCKSLAISHTPLRVSTPVVERNGQDTALIASGQDTALIASDQDTALDEGSVFLRVPSLAPGNATLY